MKRRSRLGWLELILGVLLILLGVATILLPGKVFGGLIVLFGFAAVIMGIGDILLHGTVHRLWPCHIADFRYRQRNGRHHACGISGCRSDGLICPVSYLVHRPLYFQTVPRRNDTALFRKRDVLYHFDPQRRRPGPWDPDALSSGIFSGSDWVYRRILPDPPWDRQHHPGVQQCGNAVRR